MKKISTLYGCTGTTTKVVQVLIRGEHHMKYLHVRIDFQIHPLAVGDRVNMTKTIWIRLD